MLEDFKGQVSWIKPMLLILNTFMETIINSLNKNLTISDNMAAQIVPVVFSAFPSPTNPVEIPWKMSFPPTAILVGNVSPNIPIPEGNTFIYWQIGPNGQIQIINMAGPTPTSTAPITLTLVIFSR